jgi:hypothetical protein
MPLVSLLGHFLKCWAFKLVIDVDDVNVFHTHLVNPEAKFFLVTQPVYHQRHFNIAEFCH